MSCHPLGSTMLYNKFLQMDNNDVKNPAFEDHTPSVYGWFIDDVCVYVGQTMNFLYRLCDHLHYAMNPHENDSNHPLYNILNYALFQCDSKVCMISLVTIEDDKCEWNQCKEWLNAYESQIISTRLPILNKVIPWINGVEDFKQKFVVRKDQVPTLFSPKFTEHRELLDYDYRKNYSYIYNEHYDDIIKNKGYSFDYNMKTNKYIQQILIHQND